MVAYSEQNLHFVMFTSTLWSDDFFDRILNLINWKQIEDCYASSKLSLGTGNKRNHICHDFVLEML